MIFRNIKNNLIAIFAVALGLASCEQQVSNNNSTQPPVDDAKDSTEIMKVIKAEYKAYFEKDYEAWASNFVQEDYQKYWGYWEGYPEKVRQYSNWKALDEDKRKRMAGEIKAYWDENAGMDIRNINLQIRGNVAWITFTSISKDQKTGAFLGESLETKIFEKINGTWKIAYLNFLYLPDSAR